MNLRVHCVFLFVLTKRNKMQKLKFTVEFTADLDEFHTAEDWHIMAIRDVLKQVEYNTDAEVITSEIVEK